MGPIIKTLQSKGYLIKSRSRDDERYIVLTLRKEKINVIQSEIEECYNKLEQEYSMCKIKFVLTKRS